MPRQVLSLLPLLLLACDDDKGDTVRARLATYHDQTAPVAKYYAEKGLLRPVAGVGNIEEIFASIVTAVEGS